MKNLLQVLIHILLIRPLTRVVLGINIRHAEKLPTKGPVILLANHNSHLDTLVLLSLMPLKSLRNVHPVAAADYFRQNIFLKWFAERVLRVLFIERQIARGQEDPLRVCREALDNDQILILYPEGTRGEPEQLTKFKNGIARLAQMRPETPIVPVFLHGLGKVMPKGEAILVPFFCDIFVGDKIYFDNDRMSIMERLESSMAALAAEGQFAAWE